MIKGVATRNIWTLQAKARTLFLVENGYTAAEALALVAEEFNIDISNTPSYIKNAGTHVGRFRKEVAKKEKVYDTKAEEGM